jgi:hypothetical protein
VWQNRSNTAAFHTYVERMQRRSVAVIEPEDWSAERMQQVLPEKQTVANWTK